MLTVEIRGLEVDKVQQKVAKAAEAGIKICMGNQIQDRLKFIPTGSLSLDLALGGGYPVSKLTEIFGIADSGKTLLGLLAMAYVTSRKKYVIHADTENAFDKVELNAWREAFGVDLNYVIHLYDQPAHDIINSCLKLFKDCGEDIELLFIDSTGGLATNNLLKKDAEEGYIDETPKLLNLFCKKLPFFNQHAAVIAISHVQAQIGSLSPKPVAKGGFGIKFFTAVRLEVHAQKDKNPDSADKGCRTKVIDVNVIKNKVAPKGIRREGLIIDFEKGGFDLYEELIDMARLHGLVENHVASWFFTANPDKRWRGKADFKKFLEDSPDHTEYLFKSLTGKSPKEYGYGD